MFIYTISSTIYKITQSYLLNDCGDVCCLICYIIWWNRICNVRVFHFQVLFFDPVGNYNRGVKIGKKTKSVKIKCTKKCLTPPPSIFSKKRLKNIVFNFFLFVALKIWSRAFSIRFITLVFIYSKIFNIIRIGLMSPPPQNVKKTKFADKRN